MADAIHIKEGDTHAVAIDCLRVLVNGDDTEGWMAQGIEIDYFVCAKTEEAVKNNFVKGLVNTIKMYLDEESGIDGLLKAAPQEVWKEYFEAVSRQQKTVSIATLHEPILVDGIKQVAFLRSHHENTARSC